MKKYKYDRKITYNGKRYHIRANTLEEFYRKKAEKIESIKRDESRNKTDITVSNWTEKCIETYKTGQAEITRKKYISRVRHCILKHIGNVPVRAVSPLQCQQVLNLQRGKSKAQINEVYNALRFIFSHAVFNDIIQRDPTIGLIKPKGTYKPRRALTEYEREIFLKVAVRERKYYCFLLMLLCGCRPQEACNLKGEDIIQQGELYVLHIKGTKTKNADRYVPIRNDLYELIKNTPAKEYISIYPSGRKITDDNRPRLWHGLWYKMNVEAGTKSYRNALIEPYQISKDITPYCLRHTFCSDLAKSRIDIRVAQRLMGHSTISLTADIYTHVDDKFMIEEVASALKGGSLGGSL